MSFRLNAHTDARRRRRIFNVGRVLVLNYPPLIHTRGEGGGASTSVEGFYLITPRSYRRAEEEEEIQRRSSACSQ